MPMRKQTRRSISVRGTTYNQLRDHCAGASISMSDFIEQRIADFFVTLGRSLPPPVVRAPAPHEKPRPAAPVRKAIATPVVHPPRPVPPPPVAIVAPAPQRAVQPRDTRAPSVVVVPKREGGPLLM